jgi:flagellar hook protein FlgE
VVTDVDTLLTNLQGTSGDKLDTNDLFDFTGVDVGGNAVATQFEVGVDGTTIAHLLAFITSSYEDPAVTGETVRTVLDSTGNIRVVDLTQSGLLDVRLAYTDAVFVTAATPWGFVNGAAAAVALTPTESVEGQINITTSKGMVYSPGRALSIDTGANTPITASTEWGSVFDDNDDASINGGFPRGVNDGDTIVFTGTKTVGASSASASLTYTIDSNAATPVTVQDMLDQLEEEFDCLASIDNAGRLVLTDRVADTISVPSQLAISSVAITYGYSDADVVAAAAEEDLQHNIFGAWTTVTDKVIAGASASATMGAFEYIEADINSEDGSVAGDVVTVAFDAEALSTSQYANSSTTVFQDQNGYASGSLQSVSVDVEGIITGHYSNGQVLKKAQVALANFSSLAGLRKEGGNIFSETSESGAPITGPPGQNGLGSIAPNALEQSNVDLGTEFVKLITVQRGFQANSKIITTTDDMLNDLINIKR